MRASTAFYANPQRASQVIDAAYFQAAERHARQKTNDGSAAGRLNFFGRLIASTAWPRPPRRGVINGLPQHRMRARTIDCDGHGSIRGSFTSSRHGYGEVYFESALERSVLFKLDRTPERVSWYMEQPLAIPYIDHHGRARKHYPDVLIATLAGEVILVECKSVPHMIQLDTFEKGIVAIAHAVARGWGYVISDDRGITPAILAMQSPHAREQELIAAVRRRGYMKVEGFYRMRAALGVTFREGAAALLRNDLVYDRVRRVIIPLPPDRSWRYFWASNSGLSPTSDESST